MHARVRPNLFSVVKPMTPDFRGNIQHIYLICRTKSCRIRSFPLSIWDWPPAAGHGGRKFMGTPVQRRSQEYRYREAERRILNLDSTC